MSEGNRQLDADARTDDKWPDNGDLLRDMRATGDQLSLCGFQHEHLIHDRHAGRGGGELAGSKGVRRRRAELAPIVLLLYESHRSLSGSRTSKHHATCSASLNSSA